MAIEISGKVIIVTGASSGIGRATALALARERTSLVLVARRGSLLASLEEECRQAGGQAMALTLDLSKSDQVETMIRTAHVRLGRIDVLINNAGFGYTGTVEETPSSVVRDIFDLNFNAPLVAVQLAIPIMRSQGQGHIINVSSVVGRRALPMSGIYCATKFALHGISESLRLELKGTGINVSIINPAGTESEFGEHVRYGRAKTKFQPAGHIQSAGEVAAAIVDCIRKPKVEVYPYRRSRALAWINGIAPSVMDRILENYFRDRIRAAAGK